MFFFFIFQFYHFNNCECAIIQTWPCFFRPAGRVLSRLWSRLDDEMANASIEIIFEPTADITSQIVDDKISSHSFSNDSILSGMDFNGRISIMHRWIATSQEHHWCEYHAFLFLQFFLSSHRCTNTVCSGFLSLQWEICVMGMPVRTVLPNAHQERETLLVPALATTL